MDRFVRGQSDDPLSTRNHTNPAFSLVLAIGKVAVAAAKGAAVGALQGAVEEGSNVKGVQQLKQASKKTSKGAAKKTSKKR